MAIPLAVQNALVAVAEAQGMLLAFEKHFEGEPVAPGIKDMIENLETASKAIVAHFST